MNILCLIPLALVALAYEYRTMWKLVGILVALTFIGYLASPVSSVVGPTSRLIVANRIVVCGALLLSAIVMPYSITYAAAHRDTSPKNLTGI